MRSNIVSEAGLSTRVNQWWENIPFLTSAIVVLCGVIYLVCLLVGYDSFAEVCFLPSAVISHFQGETVEVTWNKLIQGEFLDYIFYKFFSFDEKLYLLFNYGSMTSKINEFSYLSKINTESVYRIYTAIIFHGSLLHVLFNMLALVPMGSELERIMGSIRMLYIIILLATSNAILHLLIVLVGTYNPFHLFLSLMNECAIGFSGILFSMIVIETNLSGVQSRSVFGLFNVPAKWYVWILLVVFQLLMTNVSLVGHLCGILSGYAYTFGLFNILIPGTSFYAGIESSPWLSTCVRRPKFMVCSGGNISGYIPTHSGQNTTSSAMLSGNVWTNLSSWMPKRGPSTQAPTSQDSDRFPGRGRALGSDLNQAASAANSNSSLQERLLDDNSHQISTTIGGEQQKSNGRLPTINSTVEPTQIQAHQSSTPSDVEVQKLVAMGFERTQVEVALAAGDGDLNVAVEILMSQQVSI